MKNVINIITGIALIFIISSCSDNMDSELNSQSNMLDNLESFNQSFLDSIAKVKQNNDQYTTYGFWDKLGDVLVVAGADIAGAGAGAATVQVYAGLAGAATGGTGYVAVSVGAGVVCGAGASISASRALTSKGTSNFGKILYHEDIEINYPVEYKEFSNLGKNHNDMVVELNTSKIGSLMPEKKEFHLEMISDNDFIEFNNQIRHFSEEYAYENYNIGSYLSNLYNSDLITNQMYNVYTDFFDVYLKAGNKKDIIKIINFYMREIANSNLTQNEKDALICSMSVASQSPFFWLNQTL